ncbi:MAG: DUF726 domain-containing protein [Sulfurovum sp.]
MISGSDFKKLQTNTQEYYQDKAKADSKNGYLDDKIYHVPGTFANANNVDKSFTEGLKEYYNDEKLEVIEHQDRHPLQNNHKDREKLADRLAKKIIEDYKKNPDEPIRLIGHSHGGNVQKIVTQKLVEKGYEGIVDDIMYMGTPVIDDYKTANKVLKKDAEVINVYDKTDNVQPKGGNNGSNPLIKKAVKGEYGDAGQTIDDNPRVTNLEVVSPTIFDTAKVTNDGYEVPWIIEQYEGYESHINIDSPEVIYQMKENRRKNKD